MLLNIRTQNPPKKRTVTLSFNNLNALRVIEFKALKQLRLSTSFSSFQCSLKLKK